ncbi:MAG: hypothetical protein MHM6MM_006520 [Cercozoa sp. M6MM]
MKLLFITLLAAQVTLDVSGRAVRRRAREMRSLRRGVGNRARAAISRNGPAMRRRQQRRVTARANAQRRVQMVKQYEPVPPEPSPSPSPTPSSSPEVSEVPAEPTPPASCSQDPLLHPDSFVPLHGCHQTLHCESAYSCKEDPRIVVKKECEPSQCAGRLVCHPRAAADFSGCHDASGHESKFRPDPELDFRCVTSYPYGCFDRVNNTFVDDSLCQEACLPIPVQCPVQLCGLSAPVYATDDPKDHGDTASSSGQSTDSEDAAGNAASRVDNNHVANDPENQGTADTGREGEVGSNEPEKSNTQAQEQRPKDNAELVAEVGASAQSGVTSDAVSAVTLTTGALLGALLHAFY